MATEIVDRRRRLALRVAILTTLLAGIAAACAFLIHHPLAEWGDDVVGLEKAKGLLHWQGHVHKCLDVQGPAVHGAKVQIWSCKKHSSSDRFIYPRHVGLIHSAAKPHLCLRPLFGRKLEGTPIVLHKCSMRLSTMKWIMPHGQGLIRLEADRHKCIDEHNSHRNKNGANAKLRLCLEERTDREWKAVGHTAGQLHWESHGGHACLCAENLVIGGEVRTGVCNPRSINTQWVFPGYTGRIYVSAHQHLCLTYAGPGQALKLTSCSDEWNQENMRWQVPEAGGLIRLAGSHNRCIRAKGKHGPVHVHKCKQFLTTEKWRTVEKLLRKTGDPSLYCPMVVREGQEQIMLGKILDIGASKHEDIGVFGCDGFHIFASHRMRIGWHHQEGWVYTTPFKQAPVGKNQWGVAENALLFMHLWMAVQHQGQYKHFDFTVKVDPDSVFFPVRLRRELQPHKNKVTYLVNCNKFNYQFGYPLAYGSLEVFSRSAMVKYYADHGRCMQLDWPTMGEDRFMTECFEALHVDSWIDYNVIGDTRCIESSTCEQYHSVYHPFKDFSSWIWCWNVAQHK